VTVVAEDAFAADVLSTALYVMGPEAGIVWAEELEDVGVLFLTQDGEGAVRARMNTEMERWWVKGSFVGVLDEQ
jgi:thiamine biosynthesis lipoprotein ApbE